jgi:hypothetical protein
MPHDHILIRPGLVSVSAEPPAIRMGVLVPSDATDAAPADLPPAAPTWTLTLNWKDQLRAPTPPPASPSESD